MPDHAPASNARDTFVYVTYIRTTPDRLWHALTSPEFARQYWMGMTTDSTWTVGAPWRLLRPDGTVTDAGEVLEAEPGRRLALRWRNEFVPELTAAGYSRCTMQLEPVGDAVKLTVTHTMERDGAAAEGSSFIAAVSGGWPQILSNLKSLLETGTVVLPPRAAPAAAAARAIAQPA